MLQECYRFNKAVNNIIGRWVSPFVKCVKFKLASFRNQILQVNFLPQLCGEFIVISCQSDGDIGFKSR